MQKREKADCRLHFQWAKKEPSGLFEKETRRFPCKNELKNRNNFCLGLSKKTGSNCALKEDQEAPKEHITEKQRTTPVNLKN